MHVFAASIHKCICICVCCVYMCVCVDMYVYLYRYTFVCVNIWKYMRTYIFTYSYTQKYVRNFPDLAFLHSWVWFAWILHFIAFLVCAGSRMPQIGHVHHTWFLSPYRRTIQTYMHIFYDLIVSFSNFSFLSVLLCVQVPCKTRARQHGVNADGICGEVCDWIVSFISCAKPSIHPYIYIHTCMHAWIHTYIPTAVMRRPLAESTMQRRYIAFAHTYIHRYSHKCIHEQIHTHIHMWIQLRSEVESLKTTMQELAREASNSSRELAQRADLIERIGTLYTEKSQECKILQVCVLVYIYVCVSACIWVIWCNVCAMFVQCLSIFIKDGIVEATSVYMKVMHEGDTWRWYMKYMKVIGEATSVCVYMSFEPASVYK